MYSPNKAVAISPLWALASLLALAGCDESDPAKQAPGASAQDEVGRPLSDLELPVSLRSGDAAPGAAARVEATTEQLRLDGRPVVALERGAVAEADQANGSIVALAKALAGASRQALAMRLQANIPYETMALVMNTAKQAGIGQVSFQVRPPGGTNETGWLKVPGFVMSAKADSLPNIPGVEYMSWNAFTDAWQPVFDGCRTSKDGNCAYVNENVAQGGTLRTELFASGRGINVNFFRRGLTPEQEAEEERKQAQMLAAKKEDFLQGRISEDEMVETLLLGHPSTYALFQFRYGEALTAPSALTKTIAPVCHGQRCAIVVTADKFTHVLKVISMLGAAFPGQTALPSLAFEMPWTEKPKPEDLEAFIEAQKAKG